MANLNCMVCGNLFTEWDSVTCDGCQRLNHRDNCGAYEIVTRETERIAYYFCDLCLEEPFPEEELDDDVWGAQ